MKVQKTDNCKLVNESAPIRFPDEHHIYIDWYLNARSGGPPGYLANLLYGMNQIDHYDEPLIWFDFLRKKQPPKSTAKSTIRSIVSSFPGGRKFYNRFFSRYQKRMEHLLSNPDQMLPVEEIVSSMNWSQTRTIHVHQAADVVKMKNYLRRNFLEHIKVILTCHTPEALANEQYNLCLSDGQPEEYAQAMREKWLAVEKRAYREADIMIFPSPEAKEPLLHDIEEFAEIIADKDIRYMATGSKRLTSSLTKEEAKKKYGVSGKKVIGFIGRHNAIKGYDLLKEAAKTILQQTDDVVFLLGGAPDPAFAPLDDPRWIEAGWVNPADLLQALDVFVLPNRQTYYDLVLLEVLSMGIPVVATATGGNKSVKEIANDLELCEPDVASLAGSISKMINLSTGERTSIGLRLKEAYEQYFTEVHMAHRYVETIRSIYDDYHLWSKEGAL